MPKANVSPTTTTAEPELLTLSEAAALLRSTPQTIRKQVRLNLLPAYQIGGATSRLLFKRDELLSLLQPRGKKDPK